MSRQVIRGLGESHRNRWEPQLQSLLEMQAWNKATSKDILMCVRNFQGLMPRQKLLGERELDSPRDESNYSLYNMDWAPLKPYTHK